MQATKTLTLSFTATGVTFKRPSKSTRTGGYFVMLEGKLIKECATYDTALKHYRKHPNSTIHCSASALSFYGQMIRH